MSYVSYCHHLSCRYDTLEELLWLGRVDPSRVEKAIIEVAWGAKIRCRKVPRPSRVNAPLPPSPLENCA